MPRRRRMPKHRRDQLTAAQRRWFLNPFSGLRDPADVFAGGEAEARRVWDEHKAEWIPAYQATHGGRLPPASRYFEGAA